MAFVYLDANSQAVVFAADGAAVDPAPQGLTSLEVTAEQFAALHSLKVRATWNGTQFVPLTATAGDFNRALIELGWYDAITTAVNNFTGTSGKIAKALWNRAVEFPRSDPLVAQIASAVGMTAADIDAVYVLANSYPH